MTVNKKTFSDARKLIEDANSILIVSHLGPDGDALCSTLGLGLALLAKDKKVEMVLSDGAPEGFDHLEGIDLIQRSASGPADLVIAVDCGDEERLGNSIRKQHGVDINIDHHMTNTQYGKINIVDAEMVASSAQIAAYLAEFALDFSPGIVDVLLTGMLTDTLGLRTSNMNGAALRIAADLLDRGANIQTLYELALMRRSFEAMKYWGTGLIKLERENGLIWSTLTPEDRKQAEYKKTDDGDLINSLASTEGAKITVLFIEQDDKKQIKVSWRSRGDYDVATLAASFGGGGHKAASGASLVGGLKAVQERVLAASHAVIAESQEVST